MIDVGTLRNRLDLAETVISDEELREVLQSCSETQATTIVPAAPGSDVDRALVRRCAREIAARGMPLGARATEYGSFYIPSWADPILAALEAPHLRGGFA